MNKPRKIFAAAGIAAVTLFATAGVALAGDYGDDNGGGGDDSDHKSHHKSHKKSDDNADCTQDNSIDNSADQGKDNTNILNIQNNTLQANPQVCGNQIANGIVVAILGKASSIQKNG